MFPQERPRRKQFSPPGVNPSRRWAPGSLNNVSIVMLTVLILQLLQHAPSVAAWTGSPFGMTLNRQTNFFINSFAYDDNKLPSRWRQSGSTDSKPLPHTGHQQQQHRRAALVTQLAMSNSGGNNDSNETESSSSSIVGTLGLIAQPIVWISLISVAMTGGGLPPGPFGLLGALEGISYLVVVGLVATAIVSRENSHGSNLAQQLSLGTIVVALLVLFKLVADQGCVPNAKPLVDYSGYVNVCDPNKTPGLFGVGSD